MHEGKAGWEDGRVIGASELTLSPNLPVGRKKKKSGQKKLLGHMTSEGTREVQVYPGITGYMAAKGRPFGKEGCSSGPSVIPGEYCIIPGLARSLGILERCSRNVHAQVIPLVGSTLILALLLQVSSADSNVPQFLCSY